MLGGSALELDRCLTGLYNVRDKKDLKQNKNPEFWDAFWQAVLWVSFQADTKMPLAWDREMFIENWE